ncbi:hypothetical protein HY025_00845 [Candidatus Daviesbacteria bacterium]|nr:hypothetical protein [Candidatus Daviesbacteria bacterium]
MQVSEVVSIQQNFLTELKDANSGKKTSLPFIIHQLPESSLVKDGEVFQVIVIGGSVCWKAFVKKEAGKIKVLKQLGINPVFLIKYQDLPDFIERELDKNVRVLAINFAFPMDPIFEKGRLDGKLISGSKEYEFKGLIDKKVGEEIEKYVQKKQNRKITVSVANDTICLLLSGLTKFSWEQLVGGIVGTGINFAFFLDEKKLVNLEAANFDKFLLSNEAKELDKSSVHPGRALLEKEVSGAYLYKLFNTALNKQNLNHQPLSSTKDLDELMIGEDKKLANLAKHFMDRSSELVSVEMGGIALFKKTNLVFIMEGSLFWLGLGYKRHIKAILDKTIPDLDIKFTKIENSTVLGAAKLVC